MHVIRVPFPPDPERRRLAFDRALAKLGRYGTFEGTTEAGSFEGSTPIGRFSGRYQSPAGASEMEIELTHKPWFVTASLIESEARRLLAHV